MRCVARPAEEHPSRCRRALDARGLSCNGLSPCPLQRSLPTGSQRSMTSMEAAVQPRACLARALGKGLSDHQSLCEGPYATCAASQPSTCSCDLTSYVDLSLCAAHACPSSRVRHSWVCRRSLLQVTIPCAAFRAQPVGNPSQWGLPGAPCLCVRTHHAQHAQQRCADASALLVALAPGR